MNYSFNRLYHTTEKDISEILSMEDILRIEGYCKEAEEDLKKIRQKLFDQVRRLQEIEIEKFIHIRRYVSWSTKKVEIYVCVEETKELHGYKRSFSNLSKRFTGKEKKQALDYAKELHKLYNLKIIKENWR